MIDKRFWNQGRWKLLSKNLSQMSLVLTAAGAGGQVFFRLPWALKWAFVVVIPALLASAIVLWPDEEEGE